MQEIRCLRPLAVAAGCLLLCAAIAFEALVAWGTPAERLGARNSFSAAALQPDGKVVAVGGTTYECTKTIGVDPCTSSRAIVARFDRSGHLDPSFGEGGIAVPELPGNRGLPNGVLIGEGGLIAISFVGALRNGEGGYSAIARLHADGSADTSFGHEGVAVFGSPSIASMVELPAGRLLVYGTARSEPGAFDRIMRLEHDGSIDSGFPVETLPEGFQYEVGPEVGSDGKIYVAGGLPESPPDHREVGVLRLLSDGTPDTSYGEGGVAQLPVPEKTNPGYYTQVFGFALDPAGRLVVSLWRPAPYKQLGHGELVRLEADGSLDDSFGTESVCGGQVTIKPDGNILMAHGIAFYSFRELCIQELSANGAFVAKAGLRELDGIGVMAVEPDGQVIAGGARSEGTERLRAVVGLFSTAGLDRGFGQAFLPRLGCRGRNPTEVPQAEPESNVILPHAYGTPDPDVIAGTTAKDVIQGGPGADLICAGAGADVVVAGPGSDRVFGGPGQDRLFGGPGKDRLFGGPGRDRIADADQKRLRN